MRQGYLRIAAFVVFLLPAGCTAEIADEDIQRMEAATDSVAKRLRGWAAEECPAAAGLDGREMVRRATAHDPALLAPFGGAIVKGNCSGTVLVCTEDGLRGLIEDAACSEKPDDRMWLRDKNAKCEFRLDLATACR